MTPTRDEIRGIYAGIESASGLGLNTQGWNSETPIFNEVIRLTNPGVIVEVGVWNGASVITMGKCCRARGLSPIIYAVDVFPGMIGERDHIGNMPFDQIPPPWRTPTRYQQFLFNIKASGFDDMVVPMPTFTRWGAKMLAFWGVEADLIYIDAGHDEDSVTGDLIDYWPILRGGGIMFFDDLGYPGVLAALGRFGQDHGLSLCIVGGQGYWKKP